MEHHERHPFHQEEDIALATHKACFGMAVAAYLPQCIFEKNIAGTGGAHL